MCRPKLTTTEASPSPTPAPVLQQVAPTSTTIRSRAKNDAKRSGTKKYRAGNGGLSIGGSGNSADSVGVGK